VLLSFGIWFGSVITWFVIKSMYSPHSREEIYALIPILTRFAMDRYWLFIVIVCGFSCSTLLLSFRRASDALVGALGLAMPLLTGWFVVFSLSFESFLGPVSMHHAQRFDCGAVPLSFGGFFSVTFVLIALLLGNCLRDAVRDARGGHNKSLEATPPSGGAPQF
jgi:small-conductance mechanosensitive channel